MNRLTANCACLFDSLVFSFCRNEPTIRHFSARLFTRFDVNHMICLQIFLSIFGRLSMPGSGICSVQLRKLFDLTKQSMNEEKSIRLRSCVACLAVNSNASRMCLAQFDVK